MAKSDTHPSGDQDSGGCGFDPCEVQQHSFTEVDHEIFSTVILSPPLILEGELSISGKRQCTSTG